MISARIVRLGLFAFVVLAILVLAATFFNPFAPPQPTFDITSTRIANATRVRTAQPSAGQTPVPNVDQPTGEPTELPTEISALPLPTIPPNSSDAFNQALTYRRNGDYVRAATTFRVALQENPDPALARQAQWRLGEALYLAGDFTNAVIALQAVVDANDTDEFSARAHYWLGDIYTQQQKYDEALKQLRVYRERTHALMGVIDREIGDVILASGDSAAAIQQYETAFKDITLSPAQRVSILEKIAEVRTARQEPELAAASLAQAFQIAPDNATKAQVEFLWGQALYDAGSQDAGIAKWQHDLATYTLEVGAHDAVAKLVELNVTDIDDLQRGIANYAVGSYDLAIQAFRRYIAAKAEPGAEVLYYAGMSYQRQGDQAGALRNLNALLQNYPNDKRVPDALYAKAVSQTRQGDPASALVSLRLLAKQFPKDARADDGFFNAALTYEAAGNYAQAGAAYTELTTSFPASTLVPMSLFNAGVNYYLAQDYTDARARWNTAIKSFPASQYGDSAAYWLGKLAREQGDEASAVKFFQQAAQPPRTYYSFRALDALNQPAPPPSYNLADYAMHDDAPARAEMEKWIAAWSGAPAAAQLPAAVLSDPFFKRGTEYASLSRATEARSQYQTVNADFQNNAAALYALALYYKDNNYFSLSIDAAVKLAALSGQDESQQPQLLRELMYPTYFADLIVPYSKTHGFDPALFFGLVRQESGFNPLSYSSAQARGLTQVIPGTADLIARALDVNNFDQSDLFKPYVSVRFGTYYLGNVLDSFNGNIYYALMGYNGGPGNARKWQRPDLDTAVEMVTYSEAHLYVHTVVNQYRQYVETYRDTSK